MSTGVEGQLRQFYTAVMKNVLKECLSPSLDLSESVTRELETRWMQRYESISHNALTMDDRLEVQEPNTMDNSVDPVLLCFVC